MIDFRYHLVSIVAVFLALAIGIVVGSTAIKGSVLTGLDLASKHELQVNRSLYAHNNQLKNEINADEKFAQAAEGSLVRGLLVGEHVVLVLAPGADSPTVDGVTTALQKSGAVVSGQVVLSQQFFDTGSVNEQALRRPHGRHLRAFFLVGCDELAEGLGLALGAGLGTALGGRTP